MTIDTFVLGPFETNCYILSHGGEAWVIDAGFGPGEMIAALRRGGLRPTRLILTHAHADHIAGVAEVRRAFPGLPVWIHSAEAAWLSDPVLNLSGLTGMPVTAPGPDGLLAEGDVLEFGPTRWTVLHTPGHSPGGITLTSVEAGVAFVGDSLFAGSIGRTDFPGSDSETLAASIREKLYTLPAETRVLPGHGPGTTIGREMISNPYVRASGR
ncbi:MAG: MBL fold metallo-hydrolase [Phycisphaeraceae bacterium]|nr:MAG: MBL fold metallo-hydrolase [Phycisphaeraceae bacterium]